jgi:hypothetical protein
MEIRIQPDHQPPKNPETILAEEGDSLGEGDMLLKKDPLGEASGIIIIQDMNCSLEDHRSAICSFIYKVNGATGDLHPVCKRLPLRIKTRKRRKKRWVDIDDPACILPDNG